MRIKIKSKEQELVAGRTGCYKFKENDTTEDLGKWLRCFSHQESTLKVVNSNKSTFLKGAAVNASPIHLKSEEFSPIFLTSDRRFVF